ncbi:MAG: TIGR03790 family protein [Bdellovibrionota bacterium]
MKRRALNLAAGCSLLLSLSQPAQADLKPEQVAVLVNKNSAEGEEIARYYLEKRHIPQDNLVELNLPDEDSLSREQYESQLVAPTRRALEERHLSQQIRVLVTTYGVPLRVLAPEATGDEKQALLEALGAQKQARNALRDIRNQIQLLLGKELKEDENGDGTADEQLVRSANDAIRQYGDTLKSIDDATKLKETRAKLNLLLSRFGGLAAILQTIKLPEGQEGSLAQGTLAKLKSDLETAKRLLRALDDIPTPQNRKRAMLLATQAFGAIGILGRANASIKMLEYKDADAATDSELALLWWDRNHYLAAERLPNIYYHRFSTPEHKVQTLLPVMFASRLDGPTVTSVKKMIDQSIEAETNGLHGRVYFDARGMKADTSGYGLYDQSLRDAADLFDDATDFKVKLDNKDDRRFSSPGDAPDVALYSGWYKLRNYEDAFSFNPGAVGYHIASEEAVNLHDPDEKGWCKNAIEHGITATIGASSEPYVDTFPLPHEFFGLLATGRYTLAEVYALTSPYMSWRMMLIGDPLYRPTFSGVKITAEQIAEKNEISKTLNPFPTPPGDLPFADPMLQRTQLKERLAATDKELTGFFKALEEKAKAQNPQPSPSPKVKKK